MPTAPTKTTELRPRVSKETPCSRVIQHIRKGIDDGLYREGERLPSERDLARMLNVARPTVGRALTALAEKGAIRSNGGRLRIVTGRNSGREHAADASAQPDLLKSTLLLLSNHPSGASPRHKAHGSTDWIDQGVMEGAHAFGLHYLVFNPQTPLDGSEWRNLIAARPMGVIATDVFFGTKEAHEELAVLQRKGVAAVAYGDSKECGAFDRVASDHEAGAYQITRWLIEHGAKRILQLAPGDASRYWFLGRRAGHERAIKEAGLPLLSSLTVPELPTLEFPDRAARVAYFDQYRRHFAGYFIDAPGFQPGDPAIDAIMVPGDPNVPAVAAACRMLGRIAGRDFLLAGYDNCWWDYDVELELEPQGTPAVTMDKSNFEMGEALVALLQERLSGQLPAGPQLRLIKPKLIVTNDGLSDVRQEVRISNDVRYQGENNVNTN